MSEPGQQTPIDDDYPGCERSYAELRVYPSTLGPEEVTGILGIQPTSAQWAGEVRMNSLGRSRTVHRNGWFLSSEDAVQSKDLRRHLDWLLGHLWASRSHLEQLRLTEPTVMAVRCVWWASEAGGGPTLGPQQMRLLGELDLACEFELAFFEEEKG